MAVPTAYLTSAKNAQAILAAIQKAGVPSRFTYDFLKRLGFPSSNDRPMIPVLKALRFLDESGVPLDRYRRFRDPSHASAVLAEGLREAYADVFGVDQQAHELSADAIKGIFARLSGKSDRVADQMALTFKTLAAHADFSSALPAAEEPEAEEEAVEMTERVEPRLGLEPPRAPQREPDTRDLLPLALHHDIHVHLPISTDVGVYDAIFRALRQNFAE